MKIERKWAMPNKNTFKILPIADLLEKYVRNPKKWIDPFAGYFSPAGVTNDHNPVIPTSCTMEAEDFVRQFEKESFEGALFDPPLFL